MMALSFAKHSIIPPMVLTLRHVVAEAVAVGDDRWELLVENCDGDFIWQVPGERPLSFLNQKSKRPSWDDTMMPKRIT
jgi:hypothetical protein